MEDKMKKLIMVGLISLFILLGPAASVLNACRCPGNMNGGWILVASTCVNDIYGCACVCTYEYQPLP